LQTRYIFESDDYYERSPTLKHLNKDGATCALIIGNVVTYYLVDWMPWEYRTPFLTGINIVKIGVVGNNAHIGVGFEF
jgi:hypothetical protein